MIAADRAVQRPSDARLLVVNAQGQISDVPRSRFVELLRPTDLVIANDAATLPASLHGVHLRSGEEIEIRLAGQPSLAVEAGVRHSAPSSSVRETSIRGPKTARCRRRLRPAIACPSGERSQRPSRVFSIIRG